MCQGHVYVWSMRHLTRTCEITHYSFCMQIRHATPADLPDMHRIFAEAKQKMRASGNMHQWTGSYPSDAQLLMDMERGFSYIVEHEGQPVATFVLALCV